MRWNHSKNCNINLCQQRRVKKTGEEVGNLSARDSRAWDGSGAKNWAGARYAAEAAAVSAACSIHCSTQTGRRSAGLQFECSQGPALRGHLCRVFPSVFVSCCALDCFVDFTWHLDVGRPMGGSNESGKWISEAFLNWITRKLLSIKPSVALPTVSVEISFFFLIVLCAGIHQIVPETSHLTRRLGQHKLESDVRVY